MTTSVRWTLKIVGWVLVVLGLLPRYEVTSSAGHTTTTFSVGFEPSPLFVHTKTVIDAGVAGVIEATQVSWGSHLEITSWAMLFLIVGALLVSASNRKAPRSIPPAG